MALLDSNQKEIYDAFQASTASGDGKQFFLDRIVWDPAVFALPGALAAHRETGDAEVSDARAAIGLRRAGPDPQQRETRRTARRSTNARNSRPPL